jgi:hypothetical protein
MTLWWEFCDLAWSLWVICCLCSVWSCLGLVLMRGNFFVKNASFWSWLCHYACAQIVAILLVYVWFLACCSALCILENHMLIFVDLIHALPTRWRKVPNSCFQGELKLEEMHLFRESLHSCIWALFRLISSCAPLPVVSSPFASPWGVGKFGAFYLGCVESLPLP